MSREGEDVVARFLGAQPSATQWRQWRETLQARARRLRQELEGAGPEQAASLRPRLAELERQIATLEQEELITGFVEDSVRYTLAMGALDEGEQWEE